MLHLSAMEFAELNAGILTATQQMWAGAPGSEFYAETIQGILSAQSFGDIRDRCNYQSTYYGIMEEGRLLSLLQMVASGDGRVKTVKLLDLILAPGVDKAEKALRISLVITAIQGIIQSAGTLAENGNHIRVVKIFGRTTEILGVLKLMAEDLAEASDEIGFGVAMEGGWLSFYPVNQGVFIS